MENEKIIWNNLAELYPTIEKQRPKSSICSPLSTFPKARSISFRIFMANTKPFLMYSATVPVPCERRLTMSSATRSAFSGKNVRLQPLSITRESAWRWRKKAAGGHR